jgi:heat shock protein HtpX
MATTYTNITENKTKTALWITFFVAFIILVGYVLSRALDIYILFPIAIALALFQAISSYWWSDKIALAVAGAVEIDKQQNLELYRLVENLSITAGIPMPRVYIIDDSSPNAFATGRNPKHAALAVTTGLLAKLDKPELEGVIAHEMSHIGNYDILLSTVIVVLVGVVVMISDWFLRISFWGGRDNDRNGNSGLFMIIGIVLALLSPLFATLIQLAISRKREFLADANGALLTRNPNGLADALQVISNDDEPLEHANKATAHLYISDPMKEHQGTARGLFSNLFSTHPDTEERINRLREMAR